MAELIERARKERSGSDPGDTATNRREATGKGLLAIVLRPQVIPTAACLCRTLAIQAALIRHRFYLLGPLKPPIVRPSFTWLFDEFGKEVLSEKIVEVAFSVANRNRPWTSLKWGKSIRARRYLTCM